MELCEIMAGMGSTVPGYLLMPLELMDVMGGRHGGAHWGAHDHVRLRHRPASTSLEPAFEPAFEPALPVCNRALNPNTYL